MHLLASEMKSHFPSHMISLRLSCTAVSHFSISDCQKGKVTLVLQARESVKLFKLAENVHNGEHVLNICFPALPHPHSQLCKGQWLFIVQAPFTEVIILHEWSSAGWATQLRSQKLPDCEKAAAKRKQGFVKLKGKPRLQSEPCSFQQSKPNWTQWGFSPK